MVVPADELLAMACEYDLGPEPIVNGLLNWFEKYPDSIGNHPVYVRNMKARNPGDPHLWAILNSFGCLSKSGRWVYGRLPSSRTDSFYKQNRYASVHEAITYYRRWKRAVEVWGAKKVEAGVRILNYEDCPQRRISYKTLMSE